MKNRKMMLLLIFVVLLLVACGSNNEPVNDLSKGENDVETNTEEKSNKQEDKDFEFEDEVASIIPSDFPFPDSMKAVNVKTTGLPSGKFHVIAFGHDEDAGELFNKMKTYLEDKGCEGDEVNGQYICHFYEGYENLQSTKINIDDTVSTVQFQEMPE